MPKILFEKPIMSRDEFFNIDIRSKDVERPLFYWVIKLLESYVTSDSLNFDNTFFLPSVFDRLNSYLLYHGYNCEDFQKFESQVSQSVDRIREGISENTENFRSLMADLHRIIIRCEHQIFLARDEFSDFEHLYNPDLSAKESAVSLLREAQKCIDADNTITEKYKNRLKSQIEKIIDTLTQDKTDWTQYFGRVCKTIMLLGALGSLAGGVTGVCSLLKAQELLNQANVTIQNTSINFTYNNFNQYYHQIFNSGVHVNKAFPKSESFIKIPKVEVPEYLTEENPKLLPHDYNKKTE